MLRCRASGLRLRELQGSGLITFSAARVGGLVHSFSSTWVGGGVRKARVERMLGSSSNSYIGSGSIRPEAPNSLQKKGLYRGY